MRTVTGRCYLSRALLSSSGGEALQCCHGDPVTLHGSLPAASVSPSVKRGCKEHWAGTEHLRGPRRCTESLIEGSHWTLPEHLALVVTVLLFCSCNVTVGLRLQGCGIAVSLSPVTQNDLPCPSEEAQEPGFDLAPGPVLLDITEALVGAPAYSAGDPQSPWQMSTGSTVPYPTAVIPG